VWQTSNKNDPQRSQRAAKADQTAQNAMTGAQNQNLTDYKNA
jgi:hypothetical protein